MGDTIPKRPPSTGTITGPVPMVKISSETWANAQRGKSLTEVIKELEERVRVLEEGLPSKEQLDKYPALKEAYDNYRIVEKLTVGNEK